MIEKENTLPDEEQEQMNSDIQKNKQSSDTAQEESDSSKDQLILDLEKQKNDIKDQLLRSLAEIENIRNRSEKNVKEAREYSISNFAKDLITVIDSLDMSISQKKNNHKSQVDLFEKIMEGIDMTRKQLLQVFSKNKITVISPNIGDNFDYNNHFAISQDNTSSQKSGTIVTVMQLGYKIGNRILRPASVVVAKGKHDQST